MSPFRTAFVDQAAHMILHDAQEPPAVGGPDYLGPAAARRVYACRDGWLCGRRLERAAM